MAIFNEMQDKGQLSQILQRRLNITGAAPSPAVAPELFPTLTYENDRPEWGYLKGEFRYGRALSITPFGVGLHSALVLENPGVSGSIVRVESFWSSVAAGVGMSLVNIAGIVAGGAARLRDSRQSAGSRSQVSSYAIAAANLPTRTLYLAANQHREVPFILAPNSYLIIWALTDNTAINADISFSERPAMPGELV